MVRQLMGLVEVHALRMKLLAWFTESPVSFVPQEAISYDIPLQRVFMEQLFLLERHDVLAIQENRGSLEAQSRSSLSVSG